MKYTVENLEKKIRVVEPDLYLWYSFLDYVGNSFVLRDVDPDFNAMSWNISLKLFEMRFLIGDDVREEILELLIEDMLEKTGTVRRKYCLTKEAWEALQGILKNPEEILNKEELKQLLQIDLEKLFNKD